MMTTLAIVIAVLIGGFLLLVSGLTLYTLWTASKIKRLVPPCGRFADVEDLRLHFTDEGDGAGRPILLIHGMGGNLLNFRQSLVGHLTPRHRVVSLDRPGCGYSSSPPGDNAALSLQARAVAALIDRMKLDRPLVVGHSLGGTLALTLAIDHPTKVGGLVLLAPLTAMPKDVPPMFRSFAITSPLVRRVVAWTIALPSAIRRAPLVLESVFGPERPPQDFPTAGGGLLSLFPSSFETSVRDLVALPHDLPRIEKAYWRIVAPTGIMFGDGDRVVDPNVNGRAMIGRIAGLRFRLVEGAGHMLPITRPRETADFIEEMMGLAEPTSVPDRASNTVDHA